MDDESVVILPPVVIVKERNLFDDSTGMRRFRDGLDLPRGPIMQEPTPLIVNIADFIVWGFTAPPPERSGIPEDEAAAYAAQGVHEAMTGCNPLKCP